MTPITGSVSRSALSDLAYQVFNKAMFLTQVCYEAARTGSRTGSRTGKVLGIPYSFKGCKADWEHLIAR